MEPIVTYLAQKGYVYTTDKDFQNVREVVIFFFANPDFWDQFAPFQKQAASFIFSSFDTNV